MTLLLFFSFSKRYRKEICICKTNQKLKGGCAGAAVGMG